MSYVLEMVDVPTITQKTVIDEAMFRNIIDWCDVWTLLLKTNGTSNFLRYFTIIFFLTDFNMVTTLINQDACI